MTQKVHKTLFESVMPPARVKLSDSIIDQIEKLIVSGALKPGNQLPPEREFSEWLGVSRPSLREALLRLEGRGLVTVRRGGGYAVADVTAPTLTDPLVHLLQQHPPAAFDILELRHGLEELAVYLAASRATPIDHKKITRRYNELSKIDKKGGDDLASADADLEFHMSIAEASHNVALMHVMRGLMNLYRTSTLRFRQCIYSLHDGSENILHEQHRAIYLCVIKGDPKAARDAAHLHLSFIEASLREADGAAKRSQPSDKPPRARRRSPRAEKS
ncbi:MAG: FCD domain-containing protein [Hyphomicrobiales bacterium]|nr:FCD domain-containing protein [Hyphomicrobiales bacterium]MCC2107103.1 FCD domain-containing protein [Hyphomicrobiales bacterium]